MSGRLLSGTRVCFVQDGVGETYRQERLYRRRELYRLRMARESPPGEGGKIKSDNATICAEEGPMNVNAASCILDI